MERAVAPARVAMVESDRAAIIRALADEDALRVFAQVVAVTGTGRPQRAKREISIGYVTAHGVSRSDGAAGQQCCRRRPTADRGRPDDRKSGRGELAH